MSVSTCERCGHAFDAGSRRRRFCTPRCKDGAKFARRVARCREAARSAKARPCADCGIAYPYYVMDLDHVRGAKVEGVSALAERGVISKVLAEIAKCEAVCANCHRTRTFARAE